MIQSINEQPTSMAPPPPGLSKEETLSWINHELRTPLAIISLSTEMLLKNIVGETNEESKKHLQEILNNAKKMSDTLEVFSDICREEL